MLKTPNIPRGLRSPFRQLTTCLYEIRSNLALIARYAESSEYHDLAERTAALIQAVDMIQQESTRIHADWPHHTAVLEDEQIDFASDEEFLRE